MKLSLKNINIYTIFALIVLIAGLLLYITWGLRYGVWADIGIYSITIVLVLGGLLGRLFPFQWKKQKRNNERFFPKKLRKVYIQNHGK